VVRELTGEADTVFRNRIYEVVENVRDAIPIAFTGEELESLARITATLRGDDFAPFGREPKDFVRADGAAQIDESFLCNVMAFLRAEREALSDANFGRLAGEYADEIESVLEDATDGAK
jgi:hypothetical protein